MLSNQGIGFARYAHIPHNYYKLFSIPPNNCCAPNYHEYRFSAANSRPNHGQVSIITNRFLSLEGECEVHLDYFFINVPRESRYTGMTRRWTVARPSERTGGIFDGVARAFECVHLRPVFADYHALHAPYFTP